MKTSLIILLSSLYFTGFSQSKILLGDQNKAFLTRNDFYSLKINGKASIQEILYLGGEFIEYPHIDYWAKELAPLGVPRNISTSLDFHAPDGGDTVVFERVVNYQLKNVRLRYSDWSGGDLWMGLDLISIDRAGQLVYQGCVPIEVGKEVTEIFDGDIIDEKSIQIRMENTELFASINHENGVITSIYIQLTFP